MSVVERTNVTPREIVVVDVFCGAGGLTHGFVKEGIEVAAGLDSDASCQYAYERNNDGAKFLHRKIEDVRAEEIAALYPPAAIKVLVGCAPCQPYSSYTKKKRTEDDKWRLLDAFADLIDEVRPDIVSMENVLDLKTFKEGTVYASFVARLKARANVTDYDVYCPDYGIPQKRRRLVLFASTFGDVDLVDPTHTLETYETVASRIKDLPPIEAGGTCPDDALHTARGLSDINLRRIKQSKPGGTWRDWDEDLRAACHTKESGETYASVYGRMSWGEPAPTITTQCYGYGNGRFGHPEQDRAISMKEAALLQTFPPDYAFFAPDATWHVATVGRHIGNAVPVDLGRVIARSIKRHVEG
jgi:DNA (cytosine-5)-methyltransferase 1